MADPIDFAEATPSLLPPAVIAALIFAVALAVFLIGIGAPATLYFDEVHYIPAARQLLDPHLAAPTLNLEHPPLAKELMAVSIRLFGDNPWGWRAASALFGALALTGVYLCGLALFGEQRPALWSTAIAAVNQMLFVQAHIAMLDIFSLAFTLWALAAFFAAFRRGASTPSTMAAAGLCLGLAIACKWNGVFAWGFCVTIVAAVLLFRRWRVRFADPASEDWYRPDLWSDMHAGHWLLCLVVVPLAAYLACYLPLYGFSPAALIETQRRIFHDNTTLTTPHPYMSAWPSWPLLIRPIWFLFEKTGDDRYTAVISLGNPLVLWSALPALAFCLREVVVTRRRDAVLIVTSFAALYLGWALLPRAIGFIFYYLPAATVASFALAYVFFRTPLARWPLLGWGFLALGSVAFALMLPNSDAAITTSLEGYQRLMLFESWR